MEAVSFPVEDGDEVIQCRVSREALEALVSRVVLKPGDLLEIAYNYFELLTDKWAHRIELGICELDGTVLLRRADVARSSDDWHKAGDGSVQVSHAASR